MIVGLLAFAIFALVVTNKGIGKAMSNQGFRDYRFGDYSKWLKKHVVTEQHWAKIKSCMIDSRICYAIAHAKTAEDFYKRNLSPLEVYAFIYLLFF